MPDKEIKTLEEFAEFVRIMTDKLGIRTYMSFSDPKTGRLQVVTNLGDPEKLMLATFLRIEVEEKITIDVKNISVPFKID